VFVCVGGCVQPTAAVESSCMCMCDMCVCVCACVHERERERVCARECVLCVCVRACVYLTAALESHDWLYVCIQNDGASV